MIENIQVVTYLHIFFRSHQCQTNLCIALLYCPLKTLQQYLSLVYSVHRYMEYQCSHGNAQNMLKLQVSLHPDIAIYVWPCVASVNQNMSDLRLLVIQFKSTCIDFHQFSVNAWEYSGSIVTSLSRLDNKLDHCILSVIPSMWLSYWIMNIHIHVISLSSTESGKGNQLFSLQMHAPGRSCV
jgi:hypothetical protein